MAWNAATYNKFKPERFAPFYDLLDLVKVRPLMDVIDLGCGTGELTRKLADNLPGSNVLGIDASPEMLEGSAAFENKQLRFECRPIERQLSNGTKWDLVFSNAAIQWVDDHETLFPAIISAIRPGGQLAIQVPAQHHNMTNRLLNDLAGEAPYHIVLEDWKRTSPVLDIDTYATLLFHHGGTHITAYEKIYPLIVKDSDALFDWVSGTALIPYLEKLPVEHRENFIAAYKQRLQNHFPQTPVFYPFKRMILGATF